MNTRQETADPIDFKAMEKSYRTFLPKKSYAVIRVDGKGFSKYTKNMVKPFDASFTADMQATAQYLCENIDGALFAYTQSDEISVIISDLQGGNSDWWFGGQIQKMVSVTAALATAKFNSLTSNDNLALFDGRIHGLGNMSEVLSYLRWRQADAMRNSVGMLASYHFSHKSLMGVGTFDRKQRLADKGIIWADLPQELRQGTFIKRESVYEEVRYLHGKDKIWMTAMANRNYWRVVPAPLFSMEDLV